MGCNGRWVNETRLTATQRFVERPVPVPVPGPEVANTQHHRRAHHVRASKPFLLYQVYWEPGGGCVPVVLWIRVGGTRAAKRTPECGVVHCVVS